MKTKLLSILVVATATATAGSFAPPAAARSRPVIVTGHTGDLVSRRIPYDDLNLASVSGEKLLNRRVQGAVFGLCADVTSSIQGTSTYNYENTSCRSAAWRRARPQMALAVQRAREIALTGTSTLAAVAIAFSVPQ
jgi:UrcA family protein